LEIQRLLSQGFLTLGRFKKAEEVCTRMRETDPNFPDTYYYLAYVQMQLARELLVRAEKNLKEVKSRIPAYRGLVTSDTQIAEWKADLLTADLLRLTGRLFQAHKLYEKLLDRCPAYQQEIEAQPHRIRQEAAAIQKGTDLAPEWRSRGSRMFW
jgi:tetratricopeptide (TPR) repeat protein